MTTGTLNILKPSVNNLTVRIFTRAAGLDFEEVDVWGKTTSPEYLQKYPAHLDADAGGGRAPAEARSARAARSWHTSATSTASPSSIRPIPASGRWSTARCST